MNLYIRKKAYTMMDRYDVLDETGRLVYTIDGKTTVFGGKMTVSDHNGNKKLEMVKNANPFFGIYKIYDVSDGDRDMKAEIIQKFSVRPLFKMKLDGREYTVRGNLKACDYDIYDSGSSYALIRKRTLRWGNTYILSIQNAEHAEIFCALATGIDAAVFHHN